MVNTRSFRLSPTCTKTTILISKYWIVQLLAMIMMSGLAPIVGQFEVIIHMMNSACRQIVTCGNIMIF